MPLDHDDTAQEIGLEEDPEPGPGTTVLVLDAGEDDVSWEVGRPRQTTLASLGWGLHCLTAEHC